MTKFNDVITNLLKNNYYSNEDGSRGVFVGNATALGLMQSFSNSAYQKVDGIAEGNLSFLSEIGIDFDSAKGLSITDNSVLEEALANKPDEVSSMFNSENGIANKLFNLVDSYVATGGVISSLINSYDNSVSYLADRITSRETQIR